MHTIWCMVSVIEWGKLICNASIYIFIFAIYYHTLKRFVHLHFQLDSLVEPHWQQYILYPALCVCVHTYFFVIIVYIRAVY